MAAAAVSLHIPRGAMIGRRVLLVARKATVRRTPVDMSQAP